VKASLRKARDLEKSMEEVTPTRSQVEGKRANRKLVREKVLSGLMVRLADFSLMRIGSGLATNSGCR
jgi:hypothetical protein